jgi:iron complex outermembrane receptor protein
MTTTFHTATARARLFPYHPLALAIAALATLGGTCANAQSAPRTDAALPPVTVTGNPLGTTDLIAPTDSYSGAALLLRSKSTLGETLD